MYIRMLLGLSLTSCMIIFSSVLHAQNFSSHVRDAADQKPIPFASIYLIDIGIGTIADSLGYFEIKSSLPNQFKIRISANEYETVLIPVELQNFPQVVYLKGKHLELDEVIVSNAQGEMQRNNSIHIETRKLSDLNSLPAVNLGDALSNIPGVYNSSSGLGISKPVIRGFQGIRVVSMLNGLRIENQQWGGDHGMGITELGIGSVEVIKGPSSLLYGADALGGVLYFNDEPYAGVNTHELNFKTQFESNTIGSKNMLAYKMAKKNYRLSLSGLFSDHADYQIPSGKYALNSRYRDQAAKIAFGTNKGKWTMHVRYSFSNTRTGIPGLSHDHDSLHDNSEFQVEDQGRNKILPVQIFNNHLLSIENKFFFKDNELSFIGGQTFNRLAEYEDDPNVASMRTDLHNSLYSVRLKSKLNKSISIVSGYQGMTQYNVNQDGAEEKLIPNALTVDNGVYSIFYAEKRQWNFQAGIRYDIRNLSSLENFKGIDPVSRNYQGFNYSAGVVGNGKRQTLRLNVSSGFRAPHLSELLANGYHHGALRYEIGSTELKPERADQLDVTYELHGDHIEFVINPFGSFLRDYIYLQPQDTMIDGLNVFQYSQVKNAVTYGSDLGWHYHPHFAHWFHLENSFSYVMIQGRDGFEVSMIPQSRLSTMIKINFEMERFMKLLELSIQHNYFFRQENVATFETTSPSYHVLNLGLKGTVGMKNPIEIKMGVRNLLNAQYIDHLSRLKNVGLPFPGRNIYVSLSYSFKSKKE